MAENPVHQRAHCYGGCDQKVEEQGSDEIIRHSGVPNRAFMKLIERIRAKARVERFDPHIFGLLFNPSHIIRRSLRKAIAEQAALIDGRVLDFGCGSKPYKSLFHRADSYTGVDILISGHEHTESEVDFFYDGSTLPFTDGQFDAVVSFEVFEHVFNLPQILSEIARVTRNSGSLLISVPFAWQEHEVPYDFARYTTFGITHLLQSHGYEIVSLRKTTTSFLAISQLFISYLESIVPKNRVGWLFFLFCISLPCTIAAYALNLVLPKRDAVFSNSVVLARKTAGK